MTRLDKLKYGKTIDNLLEEFMNMCHASSCRVCQYYNTEEQYTSICFVKWLKDEIEYVPRISKINTVEDFKKAIGEYQHFCDSHNCSTCPMSNVLPDEKANYACAYRYLMQSVPKD